MSDFKKLEVWRKSHALSLNVHRAVTAMRGREYLSLRSQMLRAAMSISSNIVEGTGHQSAREFARFVRIASGSASELEHHLITAKDFHVLSVGDYDSLSAQAIEVRRMLYGLLSYLNKRNPQLAKTGSSEVLE